MRYEPASAKRDARAPGPVGGHHRVQVLEAGQVAAGEDQVHALLVRDVEVAHGRAVVLDDPERERLLAAAAQLGLLDRDAQAAVGDREAVHLGLGARMLAARGVRGPSIEASPPRASGSITWPASAPPANKTASTPKNVASCFGIGFMGGSQYGSGVSVPEP